MLHKLDRDTMTVVTSFLSPNHFYQLIQTSKTIYLVLQQQDDDAECACYTALYRAYLVRELAHLNYTHKKNLQQYSKFPIPAKPLTETAKKCVKKKQSHLQTLISKTQPMNSSTSRRQLCKFIFFTKASNLIFEAMHGLDLFPWHLLLHQLQMMQGTNLIEQDQKAKSLEWLQNQVSVGRVVASDFAYNKHDKQKLSEQIMACVPLLLTLNKYRVNITFWMQYAFQFVASFGTVQALQFVYHVMCEHGISIMPFDCKWYMFEMGRISAESVQFLNQHKLWHLPTAAQAVAQVHGIKHKPGLIKHWKNDLLVLLEPMHLCCFVKGRCMQLTFDEFVWFLDNIDKSQHSVSEEFENEYKQKITISYMLHHSIQDKKIELPKFLLQVFEKSAPQNYSYVQLLAFILLFWQI